MGGKSPPIGEKSYEKISFALPKYGSSPDSKAIEDPRQSRDRLFFRVLWQFAFPLR